MMSPERPSRSASPVSFERSATETASRSAATGKGGVGRTNHKMTAATTPARSAAIWRRWRGRASSLRCTATSSSRKTPALAGLAAGSLARALATSAASRRGVPSTASGGGGPGSTTVLCFSDAVYGVFPDSIS